MLNMTRDAARAARNDMLAKAEEASMAAEAKAARFPASTDIGRLLNRASYFRAEAARFADIMNAAPPAVLAIAA